MSITSGHLGTFHIHIQHFSWMWYSVVNYSCLYLRTYGHFHHREALHPLISTSPASFSDPQWLQFLVIFMLLTKFYRPKKKKISFHVLVKFHSTWLSIPGILLLNIMPSGFIHNVNKEISFSLFTCFTFLHLYIIDKSSCHSIYIDASEIWSQNSPSVII